MCPIWSDEQLEAQRIRATELFRKERLEEPLDEYGEEFDQHQGIFEELLEATFDLKDRKRLVEVVATEPKFLEAFRYLAGPPVSVDDLKVLANATLAPTRLRGDREMAQRVAEVVMTGLDRRRFPWVAVAEMSNLSSTARAEAHLEIRRTGVALQNIATRLGNRPLLQRPETKKVLNAVQEAVKGVSQVLVQLDRETEAEDPDETHQAADADPPWEIERPDEAERNAAVLASAALLAVRRLEAKRRSEGGQGQEDAVKKALRDAGLTEVPTRKIPRLEDAPRPGQFCGESLLGERKADIVVGLWDARVLPIECKVSNSATNSVKRLNDTTVSKAESWRKQLGDTQLVPAAVLSGVYKLHNLISAQKRGVTLFWAHDLPKLIEWIQGMKP